MFRHCLNNFGVSEIIIIDNLLGIDAIFVYVKKKKNENVYLLYSYTSNTFFTIFVLLNLL